MAAVKLQALSQLREKGAALARKYRWPLLIFFAGVALMLLPGKQEKTAAQQPAQPAASVLQTQQQVQSELEALLCSIDGAGRVKLMLTCAGSERSVYQTDERTVTSATGTTVERETVLQPSGSAEKQPVVEMTRAAEYLGALVVCDGAERASVRLAILQAVSSLTGLASNKIAVVKMKQQ